MIKDHVYRMVIVEVQQYLTKPNHCIWPIRTHYTFVSTNEQFAPYEADLAMVQRPSTITILYTWSLAVVQSNWQLTLQNKAAIIYSTMHCNYIPEEAGDLKTLKLSFTVEKLLKLSDNNKLQLVIVCLKMKIFSKSQHDISLTLVLLHTRINNFNH